MIHYFKLPQSLCFWQFLRNSRVRLLFSPRASSSPPTTIVSLQYAKASASTLALASAASFSFSQYALAPNRFRAKFLLTGPTSRQLRRDAAGPLFKKPEDTETTIRINGQWKTRRQDRNPRDHKKQRGMPLRFIRARFSNWFGACISAAEWRVVRCRRRLLLLSQHSRQTMSSIPSKPRLVTSQI
jgi:hypothetical protein